MTTLLLETGCKFEIEDCWILFIIIMIIIIIAIVSMIIQADWD